MKLKEYLEAAHDDESMARFFCVTTRTIRSWRLGEREPSIYKAMEIEKITGGFVKVADCYKIS